MRMTCDVIKDLMPSYIDNLLSEDSQNLVEQHLAECETCKAYYDHLKGEDDIFNLEAAEGLHLEEIKPLKKIKKKMTRRALFISVMSVIFAATIAYGVYFSLFQVETYVSYKDAGIRVSETGKMYVDEAYSSTWAYRDPDRKIKFIYVTDNFVTKNVERSETEKNMVVDDFLSSEGVYLADDETYKPSKIDEVYYLSEEYAEKMKDKVFLEDLDDYLIDEIKAASVLVWERPEVMDKTGTLSVRFTATVDAVMNDPNLGGNAPRYVVARVFQSAPIIFDAGVTLGQALEVGETYTFNMELAMVEKPAENYSLDTILSLYDLRLESFSVVDEALTGLDSVDIQYEPF